MIALIGLAIFFGIIIISMAIKVVREYQRLVLFRFGRCMGHRGPGLVFIVPIVDKVEWVDLRELNFEIPEQTCITKDNAPISIDFLIYWKVVDPVASIVSGRNVANLAQGIATTTLRAVVGDILLDDVLTKRERINEILRTKMDEVTGRWGVKITNVEIREILPPTDVQNAMTRQMSAERTRRAVVTEADGTKQAAITVAEGHKQSEILKAEGDRQSAILRAEGFSLALDKIFSVAKGIDEKTMSLQYLETLKSLGNGPATKFIFPLEFTNLLKPFVNFTEKSLK